MKDIFEEIVEIKNKGQKAALATIISSRGSTPREQGSKMLIRKDGSIFGSVGGGKLEAMVIIEGLKVISTGKIARLHFDLSSADAGEAGMICGGDADILIEPVMPPKTIYIFGAGHISIPLYQIGKLLDYSLVVIDDRAEFANEKRFPGADRVYAINFKQALRKLKINNSAYIVIVTRGHAYDELVLEWAVKTNAAYIGMIGSKTKVKTIFSHLKGRGISQSRLDKVHAPIGLEIGAETPAEIAVSIMAEIISVARE